MDFFIWLLFRDAETGLELVEGKETVKCIVSVVDDRDPVIPEVFFFVKYFLSERFW
jgi:hypothetical protein